MILERKFIKEMVIVLEVNVKESSIKIRLSQEDV